MAPRRRSMEKRMSEVAGGVPVSGSVLGVDVGWSPKHRSSAACRLDWNQTTVRFAIQRFTASESERRQVLRVMADRSLLVAAFDGPLRADLGVIGRYRIAEQMLTRQIRPLIGEIRGT